MKPLNLEALEALQAGCWNKQPTTLTLPLHSPFLCLPSVPKAPAHPSEMAGGIPRKVVYVPTCVTRMMGPAASDYQQASVHEKLMSLMNKVRVCVCVKESGRRRRRGREGEEVGDDQLRNSACDCEQLFLFTPPHTCSSSASWCSGRVRGDHP